MKNLIYISLIISLAFSACTEPIELELNSDDNVRLVVDGLLTTDTTSHLINLSLTTDYFKEGTPDRATNAIVSISDGASTEILTEVEPGKYFTSDNYAGEVNKTYTLEIEYNGETYISRSNLLPVAPLDSIKVYSFDPEEGEEDNNAVFPFFQEPAQAGNFYIFKMLINGEYFTDTIQDWFFTDDIGVNGSYIGDAEFFVFYAEKGDTITFEQFSMSKEVYENLQAVQLETEFRGGLFDGAPANVPSNVNNGALGAFITADVSRKSIILEE